MQQEDALNQRDNETKILIAQMREKLIAEYKRIYGEQPINKVEELIKAANGNEDNESTHAARRVCKKRGINWSLTTCYNLKDNNNLK